MPTSLLNLTAESHKVSCFRTLLTGPASNLQIQFAAQDQSLSYQVFHAEGNLRIIENLR
jgi:hypothetical protein